MNLVFIILLVDSAISARRVSHALVSKMASRASGNISTSPSVTVVAPQAPVIDDVPVQDITSVYSQDLQSQIDDATQEQEKDAYTSLSADDLRINVQMDTIESTTKYVVPAPPSPCDTSTGPAAKLFDCGTTLAPVVLQGFPQPSQAPAFLR